MPGPTGGAHSGSLALSPDLLPRDRDPEAESAALDAVATWATQFTPAIALAPSAAVLAETGGSLRLFGGLRHRRRGWRRACSTWAMRRTGRRAHLAGGLAVARSKRDATGADPILIPPGLAENVLASLPSPSRRRGSCCCCTYSKRLYRDLRRGGASYCCVWCLCDVWVRILRRLLDGVRGSFRNPRTAVRARCCVTREKSTCRRRAAISSTR